MPVKTCLWSIAHNSWNNVDESDQLIIVDKATAEDLRIVVQALNCATWGEVRALGPEVYREMLGMGGYGEYADYIRHFDIQGSVPVAPPPQARVEYDELAELGPPADDEPFEPQGFPAYEDGDWPPMVASLVANCVPGHILDAYGEVWSTVFNGDMAVIPASNKNAVLEALQEDGYTLEEVDWLHELLVREEFL